MNTKKNNRLIMQFMELKPLNVFGRYSIGLNHSARTEDTEEDAIDGFAGITAYHSNWEWLMPVVGEITMYRDQYDSEKLDELKNALFNNVSVYPNPNQKLVIIDLGNLKKVSIKVFRVSGQLIYHKDNITASIYQFELNEAPGVYLIEVSTQGVKQQYKLVKK